MCEYVKIELDRYHKLTEELESYRNGFVSITNVCGDTFYITETEALIQVSQANKELKNKLENAKSQLSDCRKKKWYQFWV